MGAAQNDHESTAVSVCAAATPAAAVPAATAATLFADALTAQEASELYDGEEIYNLNDGATANESFGKSGTGVDASLLPDVDASIDSIEQALTSLIPGEDGEKEKRRPVENPR